MNNSNADHIKKLLTQPDPTLEKDVLERTKQVMLLHFEQKFPSKHTSSFVKPILIGTAIGALVLSLSFRSFPGNSELPALEADLTSLDIKEERFD